MNNQTLAQIKIKHIEWLLTIRDLIDQKRQIPEQLLSFKFNDVIGEWFLAKSIVDENIRTIVDEILDIHSEIHETVKTIQSYCQTERFDEANQLYKELSHLSVGFIFSLNLLHSNQNDWMKFIQAA